MLTGYYDEAGRVVKVGDKWEYHNVVYTVVYEEEMFFEHPSDWASADDDIEIYHANKGLVVTK